MRAIAIIPARGGSKRLPRKNVAPLLGRPLIAYTIDAARRSGCFEHVVVSTEDDEIARVAEAAGATIFRRDPSLATDTATMAEVCAAVLREAERRFGALPEAFCCLLATSALRTAEDIVACRALLSSDCDFVMAVTEFAKTPLQALEATGDSYLRLRWPELANLRPDERPRLLVDNGSTYWCRTEPFLAAGDFYGPTLRGFAMPRERSVDIDTAEDFALLEFYARWHADG